MKEWSELPNSPRFIDYSTAIQYQHSLLLNTIQNNQIFLKLLAYLDDENNKTLLYLCKSVYFFFKEPYCYGIISNQSRNLLADTIYQQNQMIKKTRLAHKKIDCLDTCCVIDICGIVSEQDAVKIYLNKCYCFIKTMCLIATAFLTLYLVKVLTAGKINLLTPLNHFFKSINLPEIVLCIIVVVPSLILACSVVRSCYYQINKTMTVTNLKNKRKSTKFMYNFFKINNQASLDEAHSNGEDSENSMQEHLLNGMDNDQA